MSKSESELNYFIRVRGRVLGPYTVKQLNTLRTRGQFSQSNEVSVDGTAWESAATLEALFGGSPKKSSKASIENVADTQTPNPDEAVSSGSTAGASRGLVWHFTIDENQHGPVALADVQEMIATGQLSLSDLVWKHGMSEWEPASNVPEFKGLLARANRSRRSSSGSESDVATGDDGLARHFLDYFLEFLRTIVDASFITSIGKNSAEVGRYAIYLAVAMILALSLLSAIKLDSVNIGLVGVGHAVVAIMLQFTAVKSCGALHQIIERSRLRMASTAFIDSLAVLSFGGGIVVLVASMVVWIQSQEILALLCGAVIFLACEQLGLMLLHPKALGITISRQASVGEEAVAIVSFFLMLPLRFVPTIFALGSVLSIVGTSIVFYLVISAKSKKLDLAEFGPLILASQYAPLYCIAFPLFAYLYFVFAYLVVDVIRSIIVLPDKVDQLSLKLSKVGQKLIDTDQPFELNETAFLER